VVGLGSDVVSVARLAALLARHGERFRARCFRPDELVTARARGAEEARALAVQWAAKEAFLKALGDAAAGVGLRDVEIVPAPDGGATVRPHAAARGAMRRAGAASARVALVERAAHGVAVVILE
jgi:holo-[acyl-carrier protein] synthase